ncbi:unnamed protein product [Heligmosomoides polygyrus]|uniref:Glycosyltransferase n=1 Tax=Heligmosomoides polygyrus TaxID=6339 RepID=A0A183GPI8_HELPZ|nr:unnamed protein product [Heligmosomoides polygyrus]
MLGDNCECLGGTARIAWSWAGGYTCGVIPVLAVSAHAVTPVMRAGDNGPTEAVVGDPTTAARRTSGAHRPDWLELQSQ